MLKVIGPAGLAIVLLAYSTAGAVPLTPGEVLLRVPSDAIARSRALATQVEDAIIPGSLSALVRSAVLRNDPHNSYGGLTFVYVLQNVDLGGIHQGDHSIGRFSISDFTGFQTEVGYDSSQPGVAPATVDRQADGSAIGWSFSPSDLNPEAGFLEFGSQSARLIVRTNAQGYTLRPAWVIDGGVAQTTILGPVVPEPSTMGLATMGALGFASWRRKRS